MSDDSSGTIVPGDSGTLVREDMEDGGTMIKLGTMTNDDSEADSGSMIEIESNLGTMVINEDQDDTMQSTLKAIKYCKILLFCSFPQFF